MNNDTPKTDAAVNAGGHQLLNVTELARSLERDLANMRAALDAVANARTLDEAKWAANNALVATTPIQFPSNDIIAEHEKRLDEIAMEQGKLCMD